MEKIVLYGVGHRGQGCYHFLKNRGYADIIYGFCDKRAKEIEEIEGKKVWLPKELEGKNVVYCITLLSEEKRNEIRQELGSKKCIDFSDLPDMLQIDRVEFNRDFCAFYHEEGMNSYFEEAESNIGVFWDTDSEFFQMFRKLNCSNIIELGCGRGRHITQYLDRAEQITLVDILQKNIDYCKERFSGEEKVKYYKNDGYDLKELPTESYSALYSYDAMVHFELIDIYYYLKDIYRVLTWGGQGVNSSF